MATLVLSTVGTILGGPAGGAIGGLLGQSIDQQILGPGPRHGPRLGDLAVQSSSYGSPIPRIFGKMRVAGTLVWATDLKESALSETAKGQPENVTYSYSASFAVALSCRTIRSIGRIWADGNLIRTAEGDFTVATGFRTYDGSEDQPVDPLIASVEGMESTPAFRGVALAVFENLELAQFGNRIPFLTFEVFADVGSVAVATVLAEASEQAIAASTDAQLHGYAAYGATIASALRPLVDSFGIPLFDDGSVLSSGSGTPALPQDFEAGCSASERRAPRSERSQRSAGELPAALALRFYDHERDYQSGMVRASVEAAGQTVEQVELPAVLGASFAKGLAETWIGRRWAERDILTLRLPPRFLALHPGSLVRPGDASDIWRVDRVVIDSLIAHVELRPVHGSVGPLAADGGRALPSIASVPAATVLAVAELPDDGTGNSDAPIVVVGATSSSSWRAVPLQVTVAGATFDTATATAPAFIGRAIGALPPGQSTLIDLCNSVEVELAHAADWLESRDDDALLSGANLAVIGDELVQFGESLPLGDGRFRLSRLLRGRRGTEWAMQLHQPGEQFLLLDPSRLRRLPLSAAQVGASVLVSPRGLADEGAASARIVLSGEAMRPPSPVHLTAVIDSAGALECRWIRRSRLGWDWLDGVDSPLGTATEAYRVTLEGSGGSITLDSSQATVRFEASAIAALGGDLSLAVAQVGDFAISRPAFLNITIS